MKKISNYLFLILFLIPILLEAQTFVYTPTNPSFIGGSPFNAQSLLGSAQAQNKFKEPTAFNILDISNGDQTQISLPNF